ncbi:hypothetical protein FRC01_008884, partial [Tulasnella sp. 417]
WYQVSQQKRGNICIPPHPMLMSTSPSTIDEDKDLPIRNIPVRPTPVRHPHRAPNDAKTRSPIGVMELQSLLSASTYASSAFWVSRPPTGSRQPCGSADRLTQYRHWRRPPALSSAPDKSSLSTSQNYLVERSIVHAGPDMDAFAGQGSKHFSAGFFLEKWTFWSCAESAIHRACGT